MNRPVALIVDDEADIRKLMTLTLARMGVDCELASHVDDAKNLISHRKIDFCLTDMNLPDGNGLEVVKFINENKPDIPVAVFTAYGNMDLAITALKLGAYDFVNKPIELSRLKSLVVQALETRLAPHAPASPGTSHAGDVHLQIVGESQAVKDLKMLINKVARSMAPAYIYGEVGTGKELVAHLIHNQSARAKYPFVAVNCGAIAHEAFEVELFGKKFDNPNDAHLNHPGILEQANGGTLFLDEITDLPPSMQAKLFRAIQDKKFRPLGSNTDINLDIRWITASTKDLSQQVSAGQFRQDLFYRIHVLEILVPPLRERMQDIIPLARHAIRKTTLEWGMEEPLLTVKAEQKLLNYAFPGNVRELFNVIERALSLLDGMSIEAEHIQFVEANMMSDSPVTAFGSASPAIPQASRQATASAAEAPLARAPVNAQGLPESGLEDYLENIEKQMILKALEQSFWNRTAAAKKLGMSFRSLRYRLKKLGLGNEEDNDHEDDLKEASSPDH